MFQEKTVIITGGGSGIGKRTAERFVEEGANVVINGRSKEKLRMAAEEIDPSGKQVAYLAGDISRPETAARIVETASSKFGGVDILVNNAGIFAPKPFLEATEEEFDNFLNIILKGKFFMAQAAARAMLKRGGGAIVQTGSLWGLQAIGATPSAAYSAANAGVHQLVKNLALELAGDNIRVNAISAGPIKTLAASGIGDFRLILKWNELNAPMKRNTTIEDVGGAALYLLSDLAGGVTGETHHVDSGYHIVGMKAEDAPDIALA